MKFSKYLAYEGDKTDQYLLDHRKFYISTKISGYSKDDQIMYMYFLKLYHRETSKDGMSEILKYQYDKFSGPKEDFLRFLEYTVSLVNSLKTCIIYVENSVFPKRLTNKRSRQITKWINAQFKNIRLRNHGTNKSTQRKQKQPKQFSDFIFLPNTPQTTVDLLIKRLISDFDLTIPKNVGVLIYSLMQYNIIRLKTSEKSALHRALNAEISSLPQRSSCFNIWLKKETYLIEYHSDYLKKTRGQVKLVLDDLNITL